MFGRIAIVNRGEAAMRCIHAVRELNAEHDGTTRTIAFHTEGEQHATFVRAADEAVVIGGALGGAQAYLDVDALGEALLAARADAAWVGWGFVSENPEFAERCAQLGVVFIGPLPAVMRALGDKINAKLLAERAEVPVAPWSGGAVLTIADAEAAAASIGYPLMIKATAGGGGRGIRRVDDPTQLVDAFERSRSEALRSFGDDTVFMEQVVSAARHVEVQIVADGQGAAWALGVRDCSAQRRNQKVLEESSSPVLAPERERSLREAAARLALLAGYRNAGTVEFLYEPALDRFAFLEVNPRLQVEHPVTELVTGVDIVKLQLHVASGGRLEGEPPAPRGHAIEARLNAEDPDRGFAPSPGRVDRLRFPSGPGIRIDTGIAEGDTVPSEFDSMVAKVIAWGRDRDEARARLEHALSETVAVIRGGTTNRAFLLDVLRRPELRAGRFDTTWLDRLTAGATPTSAEGAEVALVTAALDAFEEDAAAELDRFYSTVTRGRPQSRRTVGMGVDLGYGGARYHFLVTHTAPDEYQLATDGVRATVHAERPSPHDWRIRHGDTTHRVISVADGVDHRIEVEGTAHRISRDDGGVVRAPSPGVVIAVHVEVGDVVGIGAPLVVVEAMKTETTITAPFDGRVRDVVAVPNVQVDGGAPLLTIEPVDAADEEESTEPSLALDWFEPSDRTPRRDTVLDTLTALHHLVLGYDIDDDTARLLAAEYVDRRAAAPLDDHDVLRAELAVLEAFADLSLISRTREDDTDAFDRESEASRDQLEVFLRAFDAEADELSAGFRRQLARAASHYGLEQLGPSPECKEVFARIFRARQRETSQSPAVAALLSWHLDHPDALPEDLEDAFRAALERMIASQPRASVLGDLAHAVRVAIYDEPLIARARNAVYDDMLAQLRRLANASDTATRTDALAQLVGCAQPLLWLLSDGAIRGLGEQLLEVLTRRYYKVRDLEEMHVTTNPDAAVATSAFDEDGHRTTLVSALTTSSRLVEAGRLVREAVDGLAPAHAAVELYSWWDGDAGDESGRARRLADVVAAADWPDGVERIVVSVCWPRRSRGGDGDPMPAQDHCTLVRRGGAFEEDLAVTGVHPMIAERLHLWRLANFDLERLPSSDDVYLFRAVAKESAADVRMLAIAEVRDLTPLESASGVVTALPQLEQVLGRCADDLRRAQGESGPRGRLHWNRILLYIWPPVDATLDEVRAAAELLAPRVVDLGLEEVQVHLRLRDPVTRELREQVVHVAIPTGSGVVVRLGDPPTEPLRPLDDYARRVVESRRRGSVYPYELLPLITAPIDGGDDPGAGTFVEHDLDAEGRLVPVDRPPGGNEAGVVVGVVRSASSRHPEGVTRVAVLSDPTKALGSVAEAECRRIVAAVELAAAMDVPVEWFAVSAGAAITMDSGTENLDWVAVVLRRLVEFTQRGGEVNVVVTGVNVGAQSYWNAEATMLMHTSGILVMTPDSSMVLTGKQALEFSGSVGADDNTGIGGYDRIMGPNGEAQYWARDVARACTVLLEHYRFAYRAPGERFPRPAPTTDTDDRDVCAAPYVDPSLGYGTVGEIFSDVTNPGRKRAFDIRAVMYAVADQDHEPLERWKGMQDAASAVVLDAFLGGIPVCLIGIESRPMARFGPLPSDGPETWTGGTLFPRSSKKVARAINAASGNRPVVVLANLSGFDGSPESMRRLQLEYGAEIGRAVVNSTGPIVFCVISRYHGGAFVVFSRMLNDTMEVVALTGSHASVIGGAPAAAVVFGGEVTRRTRADEQVRALTDALAGAEESGARARLVAELSETTELVRAEKLGEVAAEFDAVHSVERALRVGSVQRIIAPEQLRPDLIAAVRRGQEQVIARETTRSPEETTRSPEETT